MESIVFTNKNWIKRFDTYGKISKIDGEDGYKISVFSLGYYYCFVYDTKTERDMDFVKLRDNPFGAICDKSKSYYSFC